MAFSNLLCLFVCVAAKPQQTAQAGGSSASLIVGPNGGLQSEKETHNNLAENQATVGHPVPNANPSGMAIVRRHDDQRPMPPLVGPNAWGDDEIQSATAEGDRDATPSFAAGAETPPASRGLPSLVSPGAVASPSLLSSGPAAAAYAHATGSRTSGVDSCDRMSKWGYDLVDECRDMESPHAPSSCFCEIEMRAYRTRFCKPSAGNHSGFGEEGLPKEEMAFGYGGCDKCCVRNHYVSPTYMAGMIIFFIIILIAMCVCCMVIGRLNEKSKEYDRLMKEQQQQQAGASAGSADASSAAGK